MLVISRKAGESLIIGDNIEVTVLEITENSIKLGIVAPKNIKLLRKELLEEIEQENLEAVKGLEVIFKGPEKKI